jgi:hypothetical protein
MRGRRGSYSITSSALTPKDLQACSQGLRATCGGDATGFPPVVGRDGEDLSVNFVGTSVGPTVQFDVDRVPCLSALPELLPWTSSARGVRASPKADRPTMMPCGGYEVEQRAGIGSCTMNLNVDLARRSSPTQNRSTLPRSVGYKRTTEANVC